MTGQAAAWGRCGASCSCTCEQPAAPGCNCGHLCYLFALQPIRILVPLAPQLPTWRNRAALFTNRTGVRIVSPCNPVPAAAQAVLLGSLDPLEISENTHHQRLHTPTQFSNSQNNHTEPARHWKSRRKSASRGPRTPVRIGLLHQRTLARTVDCILHTDPRDSGPS